MSQFEPVGSQARWRTVYEELLVPAEVGDTISYADAAQALGLHPVKQRATIRSALRRAAKEYLEENGRALEPVRDVGYRVAEPAAHIVLAHRQQRKASRALVHGHHLTTQVDLTNADPQVRHALDTMANAFSLQMEFNRRFDVRQRHLESALNATRASQERTVEEVRALQERLRRLEERVDE